MSESVLVYLILALSGGCMDAYSYLFRDEVFANAQTGNMLLFGVNLVAHDYGTALKYLWPVLAFAFGIVLSDVIRNKTRNTYIHWRQVALVVEIIILFFVSGFSQEKNNAANALICFACGVQVETFRSVKGNSIATTMCIGNLRLAIHDAIAYGFTGVLKEKVSAQVSAAMIVSFAIGAVLGNSLIAKIGTYAILGSTTILLCCFVSMFMSPDIKDDVGKEEPVESI